MPQNPYESPNAPLASTSQDREFNSSESKRLICRATSALVLALLFALLIHYSNVHQSALGKDHYLAAASLRYDKLLLLNKLKFIIGCFLFIIVFAAYELFSLAILKIANLSTRQSINKRIGQ